MSKERKAGAPYEVLGFEPGTIHERYLKSAGSGVTIIKHNNDGSFMAQLPGPYQRGLNPGPTARFVRRLVLVREDLAPAGRYHLVGFNLISGGVRSRQDVDGDHVPHRIFETTLERSSEDLFKAHVLDYVSFAAGGFREAMGKGFEVSAGQSPLPACGFDRLGHYIFASGTSWNMTWRKV